MRYLKSRALLLAFFKENFIPTLKHKLTVLLLFSFLLCIAVNSSSWAEERISIGPKTSAKQALILDYDTSMVLYQKNAQEKMPTSSMSKVATIYMVFKALKEGALNLNDEFLVSEKAWRKGGSKMFVEVDKKVKIEDLIRGVIVQSGNDAAIVLAEGLEGNEDRFALEMTNVMHELGLKNTNFTNASGWPDENHYSTAYDLALLSYHLIKNFPDYYPYFAEKEYSFNNIKQKNRNPLLYRNIGADGIKTGHTEAGGYGLMAAGIKNGRRVIVVLNGLKDERARAQESAKLLDWALHDFTNIAFYKENDLITKAPVFLGKQDDVSLQVTQDVILSVPKSAKKNVNVNVSYNEPLKAPLKQGQEVGSLQIEIPGIKTFSIPLYAAQDVKKKGFVSGTFSKIQYFFSGGTH